MTRVLVLGGGWTGRRICARDPARFVTTARTQEKLSELTDAGVQAVHFELTDDTTWSNLPAKADVEATVFTFEILSTQVALLERLWKNHIPSDKPVLCFGTSSCFQGGDGHMSVINESLPLTGNAGRPLEDRVQGEEWALKNGATLLHLTGIAGDEERDGQFGKTSALRTIRSFISKEYFRNGLRLVNVIHINDIYRITLAFIERLKLEHQQNTQGILTKDGLQVHARGERILVSCGAFRVRDWVKALNFNPLPEMLPPDATMQRSKIVSIAKLSAFLPADYQWTLPVEGVEPVSQGLPTISPHTPTGAEHDRQWELMKLNFRGKWQGKAIWYEKDKASDSEKGGRMEHQAFIAKMKGSILPTPDFISEDSQYHIYFLDADTGIWHGTGLRFALPNGEKIFPISRKTYNESGKCFSFEGVGGQCSVDTSQFQNIFGTELNFFYKRSRSMIITRYKFDSTVGKFLLDSITITPFRCSLECEFPLKPSQQQQQQQDVQVRRSLNMLLASLEGKRCQIQWMGREYVLNETSDSKECEYPTKAVLFFSDPDRIVQLFDDDLVCSVPSEVQAGGGCELVLGCFHTADYAQFITLTYDSSGKIERFTLEKWQ